MSINTARKIIKQKEAYLIVLATAVFCICAASAQAALMSVEPAYISAVQGDTFTVNITVDPDGAEVYGAEYTLYFNNTLLRALSQNKGPFLSQDGASTINIINNIDTSGEIEYGEMRTDVDYGVTNPGILTTIEFEVIGFSGTDELRLYDVILADNQSNEIQGVAVYSGRVGIAQPSTPFLINGYISYENGSECNNPAINSTNLNTGREWTAETIESSNYYQIILASCADIAAGETLHFNAISPDRSQLIVTKHIVTQAEIDNGGIFNFNITLASPVVSPALIEYTISNMTIIPPQTTDIDVKFSEEVKWKIAIENGGVIYDWTGTSTNPNSRTWDGTYQENGTFVPDGAYIVNITWMNTTTNLGGKNNTETIIVSKPPAIIMNLQNNTYEQTYINWTWNDPEDDDFSKVMVYLDGTYVTDVPKGIQYYNATSLIPDTEYEISAHTVDESGNINETWVNHTARTASVPDTTPPTVISHSPAGTDVPVTADITASFSEAVNSNTVNNATVFVENSTDMVIGAVSYDPAAKTAALDPAINLEYNTTYNVTITTGVQDLAGNNMSSNYRWNFTTGSMPSTVVLIGDIVASPYESTTVPVMVNSVNNLGSGVITVEYNSSVVHVTDVNSGTGNALIVQAWNVDNTTGAVQIVAWNATEQHSGNVIFANITYLSVGAQLSSTPLNITVKDLTDYDSYTQIVHTVSNGTFSITDTTPPVITDVNATPAVILNDNGRARKPGTNISTLNASVVDTGTGISNVTINLSSIGGSPVQPMENIAGTDIWTVTTNATIGINLTHELVITATDRAGNSNTSTIPLTVLLRGDVARDGVINSGDALYIAKWLVETEPVEPSLLVSDIVPAEGDDIINSADALYIAKYLAGKVDAP